MTGCGDGHQLGIGTTSGQFYMHRRRAHDIVGAVCDEDRMRVLSYSANRFLDDVRRVRQTA